MPRKKAATFNFEAAIEDLENIVEQMEEGDLSLEEAMLEFEKGVKLTRECQQALQQAEQKVKILLEKQGTFELMNFTDEEVEDFADEEDE